MVASQELFLFEASVWASWGHIWHALSSASCVLHKPLEALEVSAKPLRSDLPEVTSPTSVGWVLWRPFGTFRELDAKRREGVGGVERRCSAAPCETDQRGAARARHQRGADVRDSGLARRPTYMLLYHIISYHIILYHIILHYMILYHIISYHITFHSIILYYIMLYLIASFRGAPDPAETGEGPRGAAREEDPQRRGPRADLDDIRLDEYVIYD